MARARSVYGGGLFEQGGRPKDCKNDRIRDIWFLTTGSDSGSVVGQGLW